jgi:hypothetical protein
MLNLCPGVALLSERCEISLNKGLNSERSDAVLLCGAYCHIGDSFGLRLVLISFKVL